MKLRWAVAQKDFTFRGRVFAAGEVFQERSELVGIFIFQKKAKPTGAPVVMQPESVALYPNGRHSFPEPVAGGEIPSLAWNPQGEIPILPSQEFGIDTASQPDQESVDESVIEIAQDDADAVAWTGGDKPSATPAFRRKYQRRAPKSVTE